MQLVLVIPVFPNKQNYKSIVSALINWFQHLSVKLIFFKVKSTVSRTEIPFFVSFEKNKEDN